MQECSIKEAAEIYYAYEGDMARFNHDLGFIMGMPERDKIQSITKYLCKMAGGDPPHQNKTYNQSKVAK